MTHGLTSPHDTSIPLVCVRPDDYKAWSEKQDPITQAWLTANGFDPKPGMALLIPSSSGAPQQALFIEEGSFWDGAAAAQRLPQGTYHLSSFTGNALDFSLSWGLEHYRFKAFKKQIVPKSKLVWPEGVDVCEVTRILDGITWTRNMINRPANDMTTDALRDEALSLERDFGAKAHVVSGDDLLNLNFPAIHAVGKAGSNPPHLVDIVWGDDDHPHITLVGKGIVFDSGGLNIKPGSGMRLMKKDMGGAATALGLARLIMSQKLPLRLRVILGIAENAIAGNAMRPGDIIPTRKGLTVEIGNTDAEGRLVLADCLALAQEEDPDFIMDFATLTGAARVALGPDVPALFSNDDDTIHNMVLSAREVLDPLWPMPLWDGYLDYIRPQYADLSNDSTSPYGGALTAALFLRHFVGDCRWAHVDMMAWNVCNRPGRPEGGEAQTLRAAYQMIYETFTD